MSQMATARALPRAVVLRERPEPSRELRVVVGAPRSHAGLVAVSLVLLVAGLVAVLLLNTAMASGAFTLTALQARSSELADTRAALQHGLDVQSSPSELAKKALAQGMVPATSAAFLRLSDGQVLGVAEPATGERGFTVVAQATPGAPAASPATPSAPAVQLPESGTTVSTEGTITRTTVVTVTAEVVETTVTSVDSATGATTSTTTRKPVAVAAVPAGPAVAAAPTP